MRVRARRTTKAGCASLALIFVCSACTAENDAGAVAPMPVHAPRSESATRPLPSPLLYRMYEYRERRDAQEGPPATGGGDLQSRRILLEDIKEEVTRIGRVSSFVLFQNDRVILEHFSNGSARNRPINVKSASKSILNALVAIALQRGELKGLDARITDYLPNYFERIPLNDPRRQITIRHLLTLSSGLPSTSIYNYGAWVSSKDWIAYSLNQSPVAPPGTRFVYSTGDTHLLAAVLTRATGMPLRAYAQRQLFDPLGVEIGAWDRDPQGIYFGGNNIALSPEALLSFGRLYLDGGTFEGRQVLSPDWIEQSWTSRFRNSSFNGRHDYGYLWWRADFGGHSTWFAWGYGGQFLFVIPSLDAVVVFTGEPDARSRGGNEVIYTLMDQTIVPYLTQGTT
jgi:CubicO group peptidase (beta-lactamase class C family)